MFHCEPTAGPLCKTIEAACKLKYDGMIMLFMIKKIPNCLILRMLMSMVLQKKMLMKMVRQIKVNGQIQMQIERHIYCRC